ncbi:M15 family metallopeptidase [Rhodovulum sp. DZ06]|uniref:M15 family metallopeptidase n=1 Tax=Rhodovulum sp. DZ06 TaxID=3425126 RepID=UPI003D353BB1
MGFLGRYGWALIIAVAIMWTPFMYEIARRSMGPEPAPAAAPAPLADPAAEDQMLRLQRQIDDLSIGIDGLLDRVDELERELERRGDAPAETPAVAEIPAAAVRYVALVRPPERRTVNDTLDPSGHAWLEAFFGSPRVGRDYTQDCRPPDNPRLSANLELRDVGPFRVRMLKPALDSLERIFARLKEEEPDLYALLGSAGSLCGRLVRGSADRISGHAYGAALDVTIAGSLDDMGDAKTQLGLVLLHEYFREEGWYWGVAFRREDSMHFEVSRQTLEAWKAQGAFDTRHAVPRGGAQTAANGGQVEILQ